MTSSRRSSGELPGPRLDPAEVAGLVYTGGLVLLTLAARARIPAWPAFALGHAAVFAAVLALGRRPAGVVRDFSMALFIPVLFFLAMPIIPRVNPVDADGLLLAVDRTIGGAAVLGWMQAIETPWLTTALKLAWIAYYVLPLIPLAALYVAGRRRDFLEARYAFVLAWLSTFVLYFVFPAEGPGYREAELGVAQPEWTPLAARIKGVVHALEGEARDTFPSGHAAIAALAAVVCMRGRLRRLAWVVVPLSAAVVASTVYLRYHYVADVLAGLGLAAACAATAARAFAPGPKAPIPAARNSCGFPGPGRV